MTALGLENDLGHILGQLTLQKKQLNTNKQMMFNSSLL